MIQEKIIVWDVMNSIQPADALYGIRILVVDDRLEARRFLAEWLTEIGSWVRSAASVCEALEEIRKSKPDIIISDIGVPEHYCLIRSSGSRP